MRLGDLALIVTRLPCWGARLISMVFSSCEDRCRSLSMLQVLHINLNDLLIIYLRNVVSCSILSLSVLCSDNIINLYALIDSVIKYCLGAGNTSCRSR